MSWLIGIIGKHSPSLRKKVESFSYQKLYEFEKEDLFVRAGGTDKTCFYAGGESNRKRFVACGIGIQYSFNKTKFLDRKDWQEITGNELKSLNGHFIFTEWNNDEIKIYTDRIGLREINLYKIQNGTILFSTKADWLAKIVRTKLDYKVFGSRWLLFNQISSESVFESMLRINKGTQVTINLKTLALDISKYKGLLRTDEPNFPAQKFSKTLNELITFPLANNSRLSLGLSGGMDSRLILSYMLKNNNKNWDTHTLGDRNHPDLIIAGRITSVLGISNEQIQLPVPGAEQCLDEIKEYVSRTIINNSVSSFFQLRNYNHFNGRNEILIDGGFGEIWRREFFNRLLFVGRKALLDKKPAEIIPYLRINRANIFSEEINKLMHQGCIEQIETIFEELPDIKEIGAENWIDIFAINTRLSNYYSYEQTLTDSFIIGYTPFVQPVLLENFLAVSLKQRKNGRLFKEIIRSNYKALEKFPLAKSQTTHPYWFNTILTRLFTLGSKKMNCRIYKDTSAEKLINHLRLPLLDLINSSSVKEFGCYDYKKLLTLSNKLQRKEISDSDLYELDWWLAFELFREEVLS